MNARTILTAASAIMLSAALATGCTGERPPQAAGDDAPAAESFIGRQVAKGIAEAQHKLETENVRVGNYSRIHVNGRSYGAGRGVDGLPRAEITPEGEFLVGGEPVPATAAQTELLLEHRAQLIGVARAGMAIGAQGADIAGTALTGIGQALFGGEDGRAAFEARIEAEAEKIRHEAATLCALLPGLHASQQALAASMPEFAPYATMTREDIEECGKDIDTDDDTDDGATA